MNNKLNFLVIALIMVLPVMLYTFLKAPDQNSIAIQAAAGKPMVIKFSSPMCGECKELEKVLSVVEPKYEDKVIFEKISITSNSPEVQGKVQKYHVNVVPTMIFIDKKGNTVKKIEGSLPASELQKDLESLING
ncbi:MAG: thioredoxin family protein [Candidatus Gastranaerophilaceae bacterium]|jgi:thioredoxin-like negative regulator of GroEL